MKKLINNFSKPFFFLFFFIFCFFSLPSFVKAGTDNMGYGYLQVSRHGHGDYYENKDYVDFSKTYYSEASINYDISGHRHGSSEITANVCLLDYAANGPCMAEFHCDGAGCGREYSTTNNFDPYTSDTLSASATGGSSGFYVYRYANVVDAEVRVGISGSATYPDPGVSTCQDSSAPNYGGPLPCEAPTPPGPGPFNFTSVNGCTSGTNNFDLSWSVSSNATNYEVFAKAYTTGSWVSRGTTNNTSMSMREAFDTPWYFKVRATNSYDSTETSEVYGGNCPTPAPAATCGNGVIDSGEQCDGGNLNSQSCTTQGFTGGTLSCNSNCTFNLSACTNPPIPSPGVPSVNISASPASIPYNTSSTIYWTSANVISCSITPGGWTGLSGSQATGNLISDKTYTATCQVPAAVDGTGGTITHSGGYTIHTFTNSGTFNPGGAVTSVSMLVVGGGGGGGGISGGPAGGGGGGGQVVARGASVSSINYSIVVGSGGAGGGDSGNNGGASSALGATALGGGGGGGGTNAGLAGASGGGGGESGAGGGGGSSGYSGASGQYNAGGGGGGAGGSGGVPADSNWGGAGGPGIVTSISGSVYYGGGGAGAGNTAGGIGGVGGGGNGALGGGNGTAGAANTGGGGGAGRFASGSSGGSGKVIIKYLTPTGSGSSISDKATVTVILPGNNSPSVPTISGPTTGNPNVSYSYSFTSTDPENEQIRYGVDWDMDDVADVWLPAGVNYVNSGESQSISHSWPTIGTKTFQVLAQDTPGLNSAWSDPYNVTISTAAVDGVCGSRDNFYSSGTVSWPGGSTYCSLGSPDSSPSFPPPGGSSSWNCIGSGIGHTNSTCIARVDTNTNTVTVSVSPSTAGTVKSLDNKINCGVVCSADYSAGSGVTLIATPATSYWRFTGWSGNCSGTGSCVLIVNSSKSVTASFAPRLFIYQEF